SNPWRASARPPRTALSHRRGQRRTSRTVSAHRAEAGKRPRRCAAAGLRWPRAWRRTKPYELIPLLLDHVLPLRAATLLRRDVVGLMVGFVDHGHRKHDLLRARLLAQVAQRRHHAQAALGVAVVVAGGEQLARLDRLDRFLGAVDTDHKGRAVRTL